MKARKLLGYCMNLREMRRCGAPAYKRREYWLVCDACAKGDGHFSREVSLLTEPKGESE